IEYQLRHGAWIEPTRQTISQFLWAYLDGKTKISAATRAKHAIQIRLRIEPDLGGVQVRELQPGQVIAACHRWAASSPDGAQRAMMLLKAAYRQAVKRGAMLRNVMEMVELPAEPAREVRFYRVEELPLLLAACERRQLWGPICAAAVLTGLRQGELLALRWSDVDLRRAKLTVNRSSAWHSGQGIVYGPPKTRKSRRTISLLPEAVGVLEQQRRWQIERRQRAGLTWLQHEVGHENLVFTNRSGGPVHRDGLRDALRAIARSAGLEPLHFHALRHTNATWQLQAGVPIKVVSETLGHATTSITLDVYCHVIPDMAGHYTHLLTQSLAVAASSLTDMADGLTEAQ
ncbi:MAG: tyrosine-type recombinase/integrase, partial [Steroidobacteraceae bacterium]